MPGHKSHHRRYENEPEKQKEYAVPVPEIVIIAPSPSRAKPSVVSPLNSSKRFCYSDLPKPSYRAHRQSAPSIERNSLLDLSVQRKVMSRQQRRIDQQQRNYYGSPLLHINPDDDKLVFEGGLLGHVQQQEMLREMRKGQPPSSTACASAVLDLYV